MRSVALLVASFIAVPLFGVNACPPSLNLGQYAYPHGNQFVAWEPTRTSNQDACTTHTSIRTDNSGVPTAKICGTPFNVTGYNNLELVCQEDGTDDPTTVIGVVDETGTLIENCSSIPSEVPYYSCDHTGTTLTWQFQCA